MREVVLTLERETEFDVVILSLQFLAGVTESRSCGSTHCPGNWATQLPFRISPVYDPLANFDLLFERGTLARSLCS
jgi:hypothetical protein